MYHDGFAVVEASDGLGLEGVELEREGLGRPSTLGAGAAVEQVGGGGGRVIAFRVGDVVHAGDGLAGEGGRFSECFRAPRGLGRRGRELGGRGIGLTLEGRHGARRRRRRRRRRRG